MLTVYLCNSPEGGIKIYYYYYYYLLKHYLHA